LAPGCLDRIDPTTGAAGISLARTVSRHLRARVIDLGPDLPRELDLPCFANWKHSRTCAWLQHIQSVPFALDDPNLRIRANLRVANAQNCVPGEVTPYAGASFRFHR
jgi:hypothetical protein